MRKKKGNTKPKTLFSKLVSTFQRHSRIMKSAYKIKKVELSNKLVHSLIDEEKTLLIINELSPLNDELIKIPIILSVIQKSKIYTDYEVLKKYIESIKPNIDIKQLFEELKLFYQAPNKDLIVNYKVTQEIIEYIDIMILNFKNQFHGEDKIANSYIVYDLKNLQHDIINESIYEIIFKFYSVCDARDNSLNVEEYGESVYFVNILIAEIVKNFINQSNGMIISHTVCAIFLVHYKMKYRDFLYKQLELYGKKVKSNYIVDDILTKLKESNKIIKPNGHELLKEESINEVENIASTNGYKPSEEKEVPKIEWLGTPKQLHDLFAALHLKNWIEDINLELLEKYFTQTENIRSMDFGKVVTFKDIKINLKPEVKPEVGKISWLGTQKNLAELFIELKNNEWINHIPIQLIKQYFTKSNTISTILRPDYITIAKEPTYLEVYTKTYRPYFNKIIKNN